jgi:hypothetical protein
VFTPVFAKHTKSFNLIDTLSVGVDRIQRNFEPLQRQVELWRKTQTTDDTAKLIFYSAFIDGKLEAPRTLLPKPTSCISSHSTGIRGQDEEVPQQAAGVNASGEIIDTVELEDHAKRHGTAAPHAKHYVFRVDKTRVVVDTPTITGKDILAKLNKTPDQFKLYQHKRGHQPILIPPEKVVDLREPGVERFTTMPKDTTEGLEAPPARRDFRLPESDEEYLDGLGLRWETIKDRQNSGSLFGAGISRRATT